jgi:hypothetical protein
MSPTSQPPAASPEATTPAAMTYPPSSPRQPPMDKDSDGPDPQESKLKPYELAQAAAADPSMVTSAQEQRDRAAEMMETGMEPWKAERDDRDPDERPRTVPGVSPTSVSAEPEPGSWEGSTRSTPEARAAQNRTAP